MTFYWWSHWFWITLLSNILFPIIIVHTYPSQEISLEYNQNGKTTVKTTVTKLYQTTTTLTWATSAPPNHIRMGVTAAVEKTILQSVTPEIDAEADDELLNETESDDQRSAQDEAVELAEEALDAEEADDEAAADDDDVDDEDDSISAEFEYKRSADNYNKTSDEVGNEPATKPESLSVSSGDSNSGSMISAEASDDSADKVAAAVAAAADAAASSRPVKLRREEAEVSNYTNFSSAISTNSSSDAINSNTSLTNLGAQEAKAVTTLSAAVAAAAATPSTPKIDTFAAHSTLEWLNAMTQAQMPPPAASQHVAAGVEEADDAHKVPFTLENVNKEDELRRAENEHRSRKSKVLSAEYKHINRYINFSTDSKNLLTRSASTAPHEFEADEGNISSEALAIQRTYFLDASTISAICFTVFGICCTVGTIGIVLYRRRFLNKPQALSEPDSSVYIDDSTVRDNSDEMYSLDNDSFLNSLEAMTIQNYWTDTVKHTKL